jgi:hypothetical protein
LHLALSRLVISRYIAGKRNENPPNCFTFRFFFCDVFLSEFRFKLLDDPNGTNRATDESGQSSLQKKKKRKKRKKDFVI